MTFTQDVGRRLTPWAVGGAVFLIVLVASVPFFRPSATRTQAPALPTCSEVCHAQGLAQIQRKVDAKVSALTRGHQCYPVDPSRLTKYVVVRGAFIGTESVTRVTFDRAWSLNHDASKSNDVWVLARCN